MKIFINYRRDDSAYVTGRIYDRLAQKYGEHSIFKDVDDIPFGVDFREHLDYSVKDCDVFLVVIGDKWLSIPDEEGNPRIEKETDWVRIEIESALQRNIPVIPLFVHNISSPSPDLLPDNLKTLAYRNGIPIRSDPDFHNDVNRLIKGIDELLEGKSLVNETRPKSIAGQEFYREKTPVQKGKKKSYFLGIVIHLFTGAGLFYANPENDRKWLYLLNWLIFYILWILVVNTKVLVGIEGDIIDAQAYLHMFVHFCGIIDTSVTIRKINNK